MGSEGYRIRSIGDWEVNEDDKVIFSPLDWGLSFLKRLMDELIST